MNFTEGNRHFTPTLEEAIVVERKYTEAFEAGRKAEYDAFWDAYQDYGKRVNYENAFSGPGTWNDATFKPKYDIILAAAYSGFYMFWSSAISNIAETLEKCGVKLDTSRTNVLSQAFQYAKTARIPEIDGSNLRADGLSYTFLSPYIVTIDKLIVPETLKFTSSFDSCNNLKNITFEGTIGNNISFADSPLLTEKSVQSILDHLKDLTGQAAQTITFHATVGGKLTNAQKATITAKNWTLVY